MADIVSPEISEYLLANCTPADDVLKDLAAETRAALPDEAGMQVSHDEGELLSPEDFTAEGTHLRARVGAGLAHELTPYLVS